MSRTRAVARWSVTLFAIVAVLPLARAFAQATVTVPADDPVYRDIDRLSGNGLVNSYIVGQRGLSRREIARLIDDASRTSARRGATAGDGAVIARLAREYALELRQLHGDTTAHAPRLSLAEARAEVLQLDSPKRAIPNDDTGDIDADVNPLLNGRLGRSYGNGTNVAAEVEARWQPGRAFVVRARPRGLVEAGGGDPRAIGSLQALSATLLLKNVVVELGRQPFVWGQGMEGGLLGSTSGRPLDMVRIANDTPFYAPSFFRHLGPLRGTLVVVDLGPNQHFPHSTLIAYKLSGNPFTPRFELSASVLAEQGGRGAPAGTVLDHIEDLIPVLKYTLPDNPAQFSNKIAGWEYRYRVPEWSGLQLYAEHQFEDMDPRRWRSTFWEDGGHIAGFSLAHLGPLANWSTATEYHHTGIRYYKHGVFKSGVTFNRTVIGDPLGPQSDAGYLRLAWDAGGRSAFRVDAALERRGGSFYTATVDTTATGRQFNFRFVLVEGRPAERRHRVVVDWVTRSEAGWRATVDVGIERVSNFEFVDGRNRTNALAGVRFELMRW
jgi:hypothetical protein